jgi:hypothetical protein
VSAVRTVRRGRPGRPARQHPLEDPVTSIVDTRPSETPDGCEPEAPAPAPVRTAPHVPARAGITCTFPNKCEWPHCLC